MTRPDTTHHATEGRRMTGYLLFDLLLIILIVLVILAIVRRY